MTRAATALLLAAMSAAPLVAQETLLLRQPTVSARHIAFSYASNVWIVDRAGGQARQLTSVAGGAANPKLSPDGRWVAFTGSYGGNADVYVVPVEGGEPRRLTWHPGGDQAAGWTPDSRSVLFVSGRATSAPSGAPRFWTVPVDGGVESPLAIPRGFQGAISPDGGRIAYRLNTSWDDERRNYRGGQNKPIWVVDLRTLALDTIPRPVRSKEIEPGWVGDHVYFISDRDDVQNVWRYDPGTRAVTQVTTFRDFDVKTLGAGAGAVVFEQAGRIHLYDVATGRHAPVPITVRSDLAWMQPTWKDVTSRISNLALSPTGKRALVEARGEIFSIPAEKGDVRNLTRSSGSAERSPVWSPDGKSVAWFSDRSGEYQLMVSGQDGLAEPRAITLPGMSFPYAPAWSPDSKRILFTDVHLQLWVVDVASGKSRTFPGDQFMIPQRSMDPVWSPDSRYIAYARRLPSKFRAIMIVDAETGTQRQLTDGLADATSPAWDAGGKYLWFLASTDFGLRSQWLDMTSYERPRTNALYLAVLKAGEQTPFAPESDEEAGTPEGAAPPAPPAANANAGAAPAATPAPRTPTVTIDFDGIGRRIVTVPGVTPRDYALLKAGAAGTVFFWENVPATGPAPAPGGAGAGPAGGPLYRYTLKDRRAAPFAQGVAQYVVSHDGKKVLYRAAGAQGGLFLVDAAGTPAAGAGRLEATLRMWWDPRLEYAQIFEEARRKVRDYFYVRNLHGTDWDRVVRDYRRFLPHVASRADLNYLLDWMGGELAVGHSYVTGGDLPDVTPSNGGLLGADLAVHDGRWRVAKVYDGESWNPDLRAPLAEPGVDVKAGDYIVAVNGAELRGSDNIHRVLDGTADRQVVLMVNTRPTMEGARRVTVRPVASEAGLRSRDWIESNRRWVDSASQGKLAYVYLPNTGQGGYSYFNRYYFAQQDKLGAVVDERYNGGGSAADYIIELLSRDYDGYFNNPVADRVPFTSPSGGIFGPKVMIINEMAGSGGDLMPYMFARRKIGPLVGTRTWGGLVATSDQAPFVDGGGLVAPRLGFIDRDGRFAVENVGVPPDIEVENTPREQAAGRDPQLERAVQEALRLLGAATPPMKTEPPAPTWGKRP